MREKPEVIREVGGVVGSAGTGYWRARPIRPWITPISQPTRPVCPVPWAAPSGACRAGPPGGPTSRGPLAGASALCSLRGAEPPGPAPGVPAGGVPVGGVPVGGPAGPLTVPSVPGWPGRPYGG